MRTRNVPLTALLALTLAVVACETAKSSNPTSPSVAGPIPGVAITTPKLLEPGNNWTIQSPDQPITLLIENASSNGERTVSYLFEVATDVEFGNKVYTRDGVAPGSGGRTSLRLPDALASDRTYYWRVMANDGANASSYTAASAFTVVTPAVIQTPQPLSPVGGVTIASRRVELVVRNAQKSGPTGAINYVFEIGLSESFVNPLAVVTVPEAAGQTSLALALDLAYAARHFWRVRAFDSKVAGSWSLTQTFVTPAAPVAPTPSPSPSPAPSGGSSGWPRNGDEVVAWATRNYPDRLVAGVSLGQRQSNMAFVRDRMIEAGICGGMDLAWNLKRGGPERSIDFLAYRKNGTWIGTDIGAAYDDTSIPLRLQWGETGPELTFPDMYQPRPSCK